MYVPRNGGMKKYNPQCCIQTAKGKPFTCNSLNLSDPCNYCKGLSTPITPVVVETEQFEPEEDLRETETILAHVDEIADLLKI